MPRILAIALLIVLMLAVPGARAPHAQPASALPTLQSPAAGSLAADIDCGYSASVAGLLDQVTLEQWSGWIRKLSGADPVTVGGAPYTITTRFSDILFADYPPYTRSMAYDFVYEQITGWYAENEQVEIEEDVYQPSGYSGATWKNLVLTIPGKQFPEQIVILSAHLDSTSASSDRYTNAPGADDNATGVATLLEAARVLQDQQFSRTIRLIWFTGEEQGLLGSRAYVQDHSMNGIIGVINLDMFGYNSDEDRCFELHVGSLAASAVPGQCFVQSIDAFDIDLKHDYITSGATSASDHSPFWSKGIGALEVLENYQTNNLPGGCGLRDWNPYYHSTSDTIDHVDLAFGFDIARAGLASAFSLAVPVYQYYYPLLRN